MYCEADEVIHTLKAGARHNWGNLLDQISMTSPTPSNNSSTEKYKFNFYLPGSQVPACTAFLLPAILENKVVTFFNIYSSERL